MENGAECYRRFLDGDRDALVEIIREYRDGMILFVDGVVNNFSLAEDIVQEVFIKLVVKKPKYSENESLSNFGFSNLHPSSYTNDGVIVSASAFFTFGNCSS